MPRSQLLVAYSWPGNVRELRTAIEHGVVMSNDPVIDVRHLPRFLHAPPAHAGRIAARRQKLP